ncbi:putative methyltransferase domain-containing protein [Trichoderma ceciliae]
MHYIRLLKASTQSRSGRKHTLDLVFTIATDLADSFLYPDEPIDLTIHAEISIGLGPKKKVPLSPLPGTGKLQWRTGMRVAKPSVDITGVMQQASKSRSKVDICISAEKFSARGTRDIFASTVISEEEPAGQVMPVWITVSHDQDEVEVYTRRLYLPGTPELGAYVEFEEEIGESLARHIWDAGVITFCAIAETCMQPTPTATELSSLTALKGLFTGPKSINILELGCGVGILGGGLSVVCPRMRRPRSLTSAILMTDLEEAERRTRSNMSRLLQARQEHKSSAGSPVKLIYENLDWEQGRKGVFGVEAQSHRWDLIILSDCTYNVDMLPALVGTLSALHASNMAQTVASPALSGEQPLSTKVFLATKPRHASEEAMFDLLLHEGWTELHKQTLPLPVLGSETQSVELYLYEKS